MSFAPPRKSPLHDAIGGISSLVKGEKSVISGLQGSSKAYLLSKTLLTIKKPILAILPDCEKAEEFSKDMEFFIGKENTLFYPSTELLPFDEEAVHPEISAERTVFLYKLLNKKEPFVAITTIDNLLELTIPKDTILKKSFTLEVDKEYLREELLLKLYDAGYRKMNMVEERGEISVRGSILDIFPPLEKYPIRIEFFGDEIETIRTFDASTQRSLKTLSSVLLLPAKNLDLSGEGRTLARESILERVEKSQIEREIWEPLYSNLRDGFNVPETPCLLPLFYEKLSTVFDYLPDGSIVTLIEPSAVNIEAERFISVINERAAQNKNIFIKTEELYTDKAALTRNLSNYPQILIAETDEGITIKTESNLDLRRDIVIKKDLSPLKERIKEWMEHGFSVYLSAHNMAQAERMTELLDDTGEISIEPSTEITDAAQNPCVRILEGTLSSGFRIPSEYIVMVAEEEVFGERVKRRPPPSKKLDTFLTQLKDLFEGDLIVHALHGIGLFKGLKRLSIEDMESDFLFLEYRDGDKLYVPVVRMDLISKYHSVEDRKQELDKLGSAGWERRKTKVKKATAEIAVELIKLYAKRAAEEGHVFASGGGVFTEFEAGFEYTETADQLKAIEDVMDDMSKGKVMDRLICGDVGYGKTEVSMRAVMRAVMDGRQAAVLVPTTVLAQQHYLTFKKRFAPFPVEVGILSRFRTKKEQRETLERLKKGSIDILIGTHRLLQKDVSFNNLGLIVVDEEHRFGVRHKERLKEMRKDVSVLTLTATPIPRTLHMALSDIRDLSIINTPPEDRLAITTRVIKFDDTLIKEALERELKRGGQVFFVHNRVESISSMYEYLKGITSDILPCPGIAVAHGQMKEKELEKVMLGFVNKDYDILLTTTIIESGLDIPSANTIIINRADKFGLAELYQLRGRVGRSFHKAYAYLITPDETALSKDAVKRIGVLKELSLLGSGFRIAAYDLEIRGAGELLGSRQAGHIVDVGFDMYTQILEETIRELKGETLKEEPTPEINLKLSRYIPQAYMPDARERLNVYKRLATALTEDDLEELKEELKDRCGDMPELAGNLFEVMKLKFLLKKIRAKELTEKSGNLYLTFSENVDKKIAERIIELVKKEPKKFRLIPGSKIVYSMRQDMKAIEEARYLLKELLKEVKIP